MLYLSALAAFLYALEHIYPISAFQKPIKARDGSDPFEIKDIIGRVLLRLTSTLFSLVCL
jgi:hypothetical protein